MTYSTIFFSMSSRVEFVPGYKCPVPACDNRSYDKFLTYMRHWRRFHVQMSGVFPCVACTETFESKPDLRSHLVSTHQFQKFRAHRSTERLQRVRVVNQRYRNPDGVLPPIMILKKQEEERQKVASEEVHEEIVEIGETVPRDVDLEMVERNGIFVFIAKPKKDFQ